MISLRDVMAFALRDRRVLDQLAPALRSDLSNPDPYFRKLIEFADDFSLEKRRLPTDPEWKVWLETQDPSKEFTGGLREALQLLHAHRYPFDQVDPDLFCDAALPDLKTAAALNARQRLVAQGNDLSPEALRKMADLVDGIQGGAVSGLARLRDVDLWARSIGEEILMPTGFTGLDRIISGWGEELWMVFADSGIGKSMLLQNFGAHAAMIGKRVLHITLELGLRPLIHRYYRQIIRRDRAAFRTATEETVSHLHRWMKFAKGEVHLLEYPAYTLDPVQLQRTVDRIDRTYGVDLLILDYIDLMTLPPGERSHGGYEDLGKMSHMVRGCCPAFNIPVLTASQAVRRPEKADRLTTRDMGDSYGKVRGSDGLIGLVQTDEEVEEHQGRLCIVKVRESGGKGAEVPVYINRDLALIADMADHDVPALMEKHGHLPTPKAPPPPPLSSPSPLSAAMS